jgi:hypothetical protein
LGGRWRPGRRVRDARRTAVESRFTRGAGQRPFLFRPRGANGRTKRTTGTALEKRRSEARAAGRAGFHLTSAFLGRSDPWHFQCQCCPAGLPPSDHRDLPSSRRRREWAPSGRHVLGRPYVPAEFPPGRRRCRAPYSPPGRRAWWERVWCGFWEYSWCRRETGDAGVSGGFVSLEAQAEKATFISGICMGSGPGRRGRFSAWVAAGSAPVFTTGGWLVHCSAVKQGAGRGWWGSFDPYTGCERRVRSLTRGAGR